LKQCASRASFDQVRTEVQRIYPEDDVEADVREFLEEAISNGWIIIERA
jgi:hypothetical protein